MKPWVRKLWRSQPAWLRRVEMRLITRSLAAPLDPKRVLLPGDAVIGGFFGTASGLGEGARHMLRQLRDLGVAVHTANVSRFAVMEDFDAGPLWPEQAAANGIAIFHVNPDILNLVLAAVGQARVQRRRVVGFWYWELETVPQKWVDALRCVDEIWTPSQFVADALKKVAPDKAVHVLPLPIDTAAQLTVPEIDPLPQFKGRPVVLFAYDVRSTLARKNPEAVVEAFRRATVNDPNPVLVIKINGEAAWAPAHDYIESVIADVPNVHVIRDVLPDSGIKDLMARADIVLSLHRSEGFGLLLAEAMAAAKPVIATGWSGNVDFMPRDCCVLVDYRLVPVRDPQNIYNNYGAQWAEPDIDQATKALRRLLDDPAERQRLGQMARAHVTRFFAPENWLAALPASFWQSLTPEAKGQSPAQQKNTKYG